MKERSKRDGGRRKQIKAASNNLVMMIDNPSSKKQILKQWIMERCMSCPKGNETR
jgi:hypothetical protein